MKSEENQPFGRIRLLEGEGTWLTLHSRYGLLEEVNLQDDFVALTGQRLIGSWLNDGRHRAVLMPLQNVDAVEVTGRPRSMGPLATGGLLVLAAATVVWLAAALNLGGALSWIIGAVLALLGAIKASTYFVTEDQATITFRSGTAEVGMPLRTPQALGAAYELVHVFFQARASHAPTLTQEGLDERPQPPASAADFLEPGGRPDAMEGLSGDADPLQWTAAKAPEPPTGHPEPSITRHLPESSQAQGRGDI